MANPLAGCAGHRHVVPTGRVSPKRAGEPDDGKAPRTPGHPGQRQRRCDARAARARPAWSPCCESRWACASWPNAWRRRSIAGEARTCRHNAPAPTSSDTLYVPAACSNLAALERSLAHAPEELDATGGPSKWTALACARYSRLVTPANGAAPTLPETCLPASAFISTDSSLSGSAITLTEPASADLTSVKISLRN